MTVYKQYDTRWGSKLYPSKPSTVASSGCGLVAVTHCVIEQDKYSHYTPLNCYSFMKQYAVRGHGTQWEGIRKGLEHWGYKVYEPNISKSMESAWSELNKGNRIGVLLLKAGTRNGVTWTGSGHYVAFTGYKVENGKHYFYTKDSGGRNHTGWYQYEKYIQGLLPKIWIVERIKENIPAIKKTKGYTGKLPTKTIKKGSTGTSVKNWQLFLRWAFDTTKLKAGGGFRDVTEKYTIYFQKQTGLVPDGIVGPKTLAKAKTFK